jgi:hypothetical protein
MIARLVIRVAAIVSITFPFLLVAEAAIGWRVDPATAIYSIVVITFAVVGWLVSERQPANVVGPLMVTFALLFALVLPADVYVRAPGEPPGAAVIGTLASASDAPLLALLALIMLRFPNGSLPSPAWRWATPVFVAVVITAFVGVSLDGAPLPLYRAYTSPAGIPGFPGLAFLYLGYVLMLVLLVGAVVSLVVRWRQGRATEREQVKWIAAAAVVALVGEVANVVTFNPDNPNSVIGIASAVGFALVPVAMGIAILRYRLYEIDRIISRTLSYAVVTAILGAVFVGVILLFQTVLSGITGYGGIPVAISTLAVVALFQPVLRRVRRAVDRRFDRARYDGERTAGEFAERLRWETDMERVSGDLRTTVASAVAPANLAIWLRPGRPNR